MKVESDDVTFNGTVIFSKLPEPSSSTLMNTATPDISNLTMVIGSGAVVTITNFFGGVDSHPLRILGDGTTTITNGTNIFTNTGANKLLAVHKVYTFNFIKSLGLWIENA